MGLYYPEFPYLVYFSTLVATIQQGIVLVNCCLIIINLSLPDGAIDPPHFYYTHTDINAALCAASREVPLQDIADTVRNDSPSPTIQTLQSQQPVAIANPPPVIITSDPLPMTSMWP